MHGVGSPSVRDGIGSVRRNGGRGELRVGVIGAGPAGLSLAKCLREAGYHNVVLFEKSGDVGGKSHTLEWEGYACDLGTCYTALGYGRVHAWLAEYGLTTVPCQVVYLDGRPVTRYPLQGVAPREALGQLLRYSYHRRRFRRGRMAPEEYSLPALEWLRRRRLGVIERVMHLAITGMGYGYLDEVPIYHPFHFVDPALLLGCVKGWVYEVPEGWQTLWRRMSADFEVHLHTPPTRIERSPAGVTVHTASGAHPVDQLVVSIPLDDARGLMEMTPLEESIARSIRWTDYVTTLVVSGSWFGDPEGARFVRGRIDSASAPTAGHLMGAKRLSAARAGGRPGRPAYVCYQRAGGFSDAELLEILRADLREQGATLDEVVVQKRWRYMPTLSPEALRQGIVARMREVQGRNRTWYTGASFSHENVRDIVDFNHALARRIAAATD